MSLREKQFGFREYVLDAGEKTLLRDGKPVQITPKVFRLLEVMVENHGRLVEKGFLMAAVWPDSFVEESNLTFSVRQLRKLLGDDKQNPTFIETVPRRGYRFIPQVTEIPDNGDRDVVRISEDRAVASTRWTGWAKPLAASLLIAAVTVTAGYVVLRDGRAKEAGGREPTNLTLTYETVASVNGRITSAVSPDGKYVAYTNIVNGKYSLWLRQLSGGGNMQIVPPRDGVNYYGIRFSGDSEYVYFLSRVGPGPTRLDRVSIVGGSIKTGILNDLDGAFSISPDNRRISFRKYGKDKSSLLVADIDGGNARIVHETSKTFTDNIFSPDNKTIAFAEGQSDTGGRDFGVFLIDADSGELKSASDFRWYNVRGIAWLPDRSGLLVTARMTVDDPPQIWEVNLSDGGVRKTTNTQSVFSTISASSDMSVVLVTQISRSSQMYLAPLSEPNNARPVTKASQGLAWAADGSVLYAAKSGSNHDIWSLSADGSTQKQITSDPSSDVDPRASPDGRFIVFVSDRAGVRNIWRMNADGGAPLRLTAGGGEQSPVVTVDGKSVLFTSTEKPGIWQVSLDGGEERQVSSADARRISISRDGTKLAYSSGTGDDNSIVVETFPNGEPIRRFAIPERETPGQDIVWTADDAALIYGAENSAMIGNLWKQPLAGGPAEKISDFTTDEIFFIGLSPDGSELALVRGVWNHEVVVVKGFKGEIQSP